jgi:hypothetical protein
MSYKGFVVTPEIAKRWAEAKAEKAAAALRATTTTTHEQRLANLRASKERNAQAKPHIRAQLDAMVDKEIEEELEAEKKKKSTSLAPREKELEGLFGGKNRKSRKSRVRKTRAMRKRKTTRRRS